MILKKIREGDKYKLQKQLSLKILQICDIPIPEQNIGLTLENIKIIEEKLNIQINIICAENFNSIIYSGPENYIKIYLYKNYNHFDVINSMTGFFGSSYYCHTCKKCYYHKDTDKCKKPEKLSKCLVCNGKKHLEYVINSPSWKYCDNCFRYFYNEECFNNHKENKTCESNSAFQSKRGYFVFELLRNYTEHLNDIFQIYSSNVYRL
jgi:hypothetical protein